MATDKWEAPLRRWPILFVCRLVLSYHLDTLIGDWKVSQHRRTDDMYKLNESQRALRDGSNGLCPTAPTCQCLTFYIKWTCFQKEEKWFISRCLLIGLLIRKKRLISYPFSITNKWTYIAYDLKKRVKNIISINYPKTTIHSLGIYFFGGFYLDFLILLWNGMGIFHQPSGENDHASL